MISIKAVHEKESGKDVNFTIVLTAFAGSFPSASRLYWLMFSMAYWNFGPVHNRLSSLSEQYFV